MVRVWFNHWFSAAYHLIRLMGAGGEGELRFIGSSANPDAVYRAACDEFYVEPQGLREADYVRFCLDFCRGHGVQVFVPRRNLAAVAEHAADFAALGVTLLAERDAALIRDMDDKRAAYGRVRAFAPDLVPDSGCASSMEEFEAEYARLAALYPRVCYKLAVDEGAQSFRVIVAEGAAGDLYGRPGNKVTLAAARAVLSAYSFRVPVLLMPYLDGVEVSADCLATPGGAIIIPRYKVGSRYSEVRFDRQAVESCSRVMAGLGLGMPANVQFRAGAGGLFLLEVNPRMSGGLPLSCAASGINIPRIALRAALGREERWEYPPFQTRRVAQVESPVCLDDGRAL